MYSSAFLRLLQLVLCQVLSSLGTSPEVRFSR